MWSKISGLNKAALVCFILAKLTFLSVVPAVFLSRSAAVTLGIMYITLVVATIGLVVYKIVQDGKNEVSANSR
jgi:hypothetical protein